MNASSHSPAAKRRAKGAQVTFGAQDTGEGIVFGARALVVYPDFAKADANAMRDAPSRLAEAVSLAQAIALDVRAQEIVRIRAARAATLFGSGQLERLAALVAGEEIELVVIDGQVSPIQQRNLEKELKAKVIDRTGLILEIFGERARTAEGMLQVELAHLNYQASRLVRSWTHLERQRGGFGFLGGPGETQIEADRRLIRDRIARLRQELEDVRRTRALHRRQRQKAPYPVVALVGYTNAGKSTLFNRLTGADVMAKDLLFATLDPTMRAIQLPGIDKVILSDTVGFVSSLPTQLVAAFRATLEEVLEADCIVHVRDVAHPDTQAQAADVYQVLRDLGVAEPGEGAAKLMIEAMNKVDLLEGERKAAVLADCARRDDAVAISAVSGEGLEDLKKAIVERLQASARVHHILLTPAQGAQMAWLYKYGEVLEREDMEDGHIRLVVRLDTATHQRFLAM